MIRVSPATRAVLTLLLVLASPSVHPAAATEQRGVRPATQVFYMSALVGNARTWVMECRTIQASSSFDSAGASATVYPSGWMPTTVFAYDHRWTGGRSLTVADRTITVEPEQHEGGRRPPLGLMYAGAAIGGGSWGVEYVAVAFWGATMRCTGEIDGWPQEVHELPGEHAFHASPDAFSTGAAVQEGDIEVTAARTFERALPGGPMMARLTKGDRGQAVLKTDDVSRYSVQDCSFAPSCQMGRPSPTHLTAAIAASQSSAGTAGQIWAIALPPQD